MPTNLCLSMFFKETREGTLWVGEEWPRGVSVISSPATSRIPQLTFSSQKTWGKCHLFLSFFFFHQWELESIRKKKKESRKRCRSTAARLCLFPLGISLMWKKTEKKNTWAPSQTLDPRFDKMLSHKDEVELGYVVTDETSDYLEETAVSWPRSLSTLRWRSFTFLFHVEIVERIIKMNGSHHSLFIFLVSISTGKVMKDMKTPHLPYHTLPEGPFPPFTLMM